MEKLHPDHGWTPLENFGLGTPLKQSANCMHLTDSCSLFFSSFRLFNSLPLAACLCVRASCLHFDSNLNCNECQRDFLNCIDIIYNYPNSQCIRAHRDWKQNRWNASGKYIALSVFMCVQALNVIIHFTFFQMFRFNSSNIVLCCVQYFNLVHCHCHLPKA